jgi:hypothetical protein
LIDQDDLLGGDVFLLQRPFQAPHAGNRFRILQRVDDQEDVMVNDRLIASFRQPFA